jgi:RNase P subunit RPR2
MKVISKGRSKDWKRRMHCTGCDALLEVTRADCKYVSDQRDGDFYSFYCGGCRAYNTVAARLVDR